MTKVYVKVKSDSREITRLEVVTSDSEKVAIIQFEKGVAVDAINSIENLSLKVMEETKLIGYQVKHELRYDNELHHGLGLVMSDRFEKIKLENGTFKILAPRLVALNKIIRKNKETFLLEV